MQRSGLIRLGSFTASATSAAVPGQPGYVPVALHATAWTGATTCTFHLILDDGVGASAYKAADPGALTLTADTWMSIPEGTRLLLGATPSWKIVLNAGTPTITFRILYKPDLSAAT